jgi:glycosyltransferase involved in cell wall biosynthesis
MITVSVVVCTRNRSQSLVDALRSLMVLETGNLFSYEIVVVNNNSTDDTSRAVRDLAVSAPISIREFVETRPGVVFARNRGVEEATGEWIAFFDDDQLADPRWLLELLECGLQKKSLCVGGAVTLKLPEGFNEPISPFCRMLLGETVGMEELQRYSPRRTPGAGNLIVHQSVFETVGLFREEFNKRGEDTDLFLRMHAAGIEGWYTPKAIIHHVIPPERLTPAFLLRLSQVMSAGMAQVERNAVGKLFFPLVWCARLGHLACVMLPRLLWSRLTRNHSRYLGIKCQMRLSQCYLGEGFPLLLPTS